MVILFNGIIIICVGFRRVQLDSIRPGGEEERRRGLHVHRGQLRSHRPVHNYANRQL